MKKSLSVAIVGATGTVGKEMLLVLEERHFPIHTLHLFASEKSVGKEITWQGKRYVSQILKPGCFEGIDLVFFDASDAISQKWVFQAVASGAWVIDNSSVFRLHPEVLLIVPEVNGALLQSRLQMRAKFGFYTKKTEKSSIFDRIISGPNCSTTQLVLALKPLQENWSLKRVVISTFQSTSGGGSAAMLELQTQTQAYLEDERTTLLPQVFPHPIAFNCIPQIGSFQKTGYTSEEEKLMNESKKLLNLPKLRITATAVRVPTFFSHSESVNVELGKAFQIEEVLSVLKAQKGLILHEAQEQYPMGVMVRGQDSVFLGRIRRDPSIKNGLNFWLVADNLRKGAALNAIQIAELLLYSIEENIFSSEFKS